MCWQKAAVKMTVNNFFPIRKSSGLKAKIMLPKKWQSGLTAENIHIFNRKHMYLALRRKSYPQSRP